MWLRYKILDVEVIYLSSGKEMKVWVSEIEFSRKEKKHKNV